MITHLYWLTAQTNLHVGSGDSNYGVIDNLVQRDVLTELPSIHESSLKGALKEYYTHLIKTEYNVERKIAHKKDQIKTIFGNDDASGEYRFYGGHFLTIPVRTNNAPFIHASCPALLKDFIAYSALFGVELSGEWQQLAGLSPINNKPLVFNPNLVGWQVEYSDLVALRHSSDITVPTALGTNQTFVLLSDSDFKRIAGPNKLPVIARNSLEDGRSVNLWYEEIVPRQSKFYCFIQQLADTEYDSWFETGLTKPIQVGANASIGYGLMKFTKHS